MNARYPGLILATALAATPALAIDEFHAPPVDSSLEAASRYAAASSQGRDVLLKARPTDAEVGDAESFGREVRWLGLLAGSVFLQPNCSPGDSGCVALNPAPAPTSFDVPDVAVVTLPGGSSHSLLCHWQTPVVGVAFANPSASPVDYRLEAMPVYRIHSRVLRGASDPVTGQPYNGVLELPMPAIATEGEIAAGDYKVEQFTGARICIGGLVSRKALMQRYGLSERDATRFFREPIQVRMGIRGSAHNVDIANLYFGTRLTGD